MTTLLNYTIWKRLIQPAGVPELSDEEKEAQQEKNRLPSNSGRYLMMRGTYVIPDETTIPTFLKASHDRDMETIRSLVRSDKILVFARNSRRASRLPVTRQERLDSSPSKSWKATTPIARASPQTI